MKNERLPFPEMMGAAGKAWRYDLARIRRREGWWRRKPDASLLSWLIEAKWAHPLWHSYALHLIHLRPVEGLNEPKIYLPGATHEIFLYALDPEEPRDLTRIARHLYPSNFGAQFISLDCEHYDDRGAIGRMNDTVREIVEGRLSPDTDHMQSWLARYGDAMIKGDPRRAGETKITLISPEGEDLNIIVEPQPPTPRQS